MHYALQRAKKEAFTSLKKHVGKGFTITPDMLVPPPKPEYGDLSFACFQLAKGLGRNPAEIATELAAKIGPTGIVAKITALGPYVNFTWNTETFGDLVLQDIARTKKRYGRGATGKGKRILIEYANLNTHKAIHIGHARNFAVGQSMTNILRACGYDVTPVCYINDLGNNVARCLWGLTHLHADTDPGEDKLDFLDKAYVDAVAALENDDAIKAEVSQIQRDLELMQGEYVPLWKKTQKWSEEGLFSVYNLWGLELQKTYWEHEFIDETHAIVKKLLTEGIARASEGAVIVDLSEQNNGINLLRKSDGTLLYNAKDLALAYKKEEDYAADRSLYVIDVRQSLPMRQLAGTLARMHFPREIVHLGYDFVTLPEGAMSSRKGNAIKLNDLYDALVEELSTQTAARHESWSKKKVQKNARSLALSCIKFAMLRQEMDRPITFRLEEVMATEGKTAPYILYTIARLRSVVQKVGDTPRINTTLLTTPEEKTLLRVLAEFPDAVMRAGLEYRPTMITEHLFTLAQAFSQYYENVNVSKEEQRDVRQARVALYEAVYTVLKNGSEILGMEVLKEM